MPPSCHGSSRSPSNERTEQDCADRNEQGHQRHVGRARPRRGSGNRGGRRARCTSSARPRTAPQPAARHRQLPRTVGEKRDRQHQDVVAGDLTRRRDRRRRARGTAARRRRRRHRTARRRAPRAAPQVLAEAGPAHRARSSPRPRRSRAHAERAGARQLFRPGSRVRDQDGEERRRRVQDRGQPARDLRLPPQDQAERHQIVQRADERRKRPIEAETPASDGPKRGRRGGARGRDPDPAEHDGEGRQLGDGDRAEEERPAPQEGERRNRAATRRLPCRTRARRFLERWAACPRHAPDSRGKATGGRGTPAPASCGRTPVLARTRQAMAADPRGPQNGSAPAYTRHPPSRLSGNPPRRPSSHEKSRLISRLA